MRDSDLQTVRGIPLFAQMDEANFASLVRGAYLQRFPSQLQLITEGEPADFLYVVVEGCVEMFATAKRRETTLAIQRPVSTFILAAVLKDAVYLMSARTMEPSRLLMIPSQDLRAMMSVDPALARAMVTELASSFRIVIKSLKNQKLRPAVERLANYVLQEHAAQGANGQFTLPFDKRTLASFLGMTPENLSRAFNTLRPYGVVVNGAEIVLEKIKDLMNLAKPTSLIDDEKI